MKKLIITIIPLIVFIGCRSEAIDIYQVVVLDSSFQQIQLIDQPDKIKIINDLWRGLETIDALPNINWTHKLDIQSSKLSGRWLYNEEGYLAKLNKRLKPMYKVTDTRRFNKVVLGF